eukprot:1892300-Amphidinium_carterae.1
MEALEAVTWVELEHLTTVQGKQGDSELQGTSNAGDGIKDDMALNGVCNVHRVRDSNGVGKPCAHEGEVMASFLRVVPERMSES